MGIDPAQKLSFLQVRLSENEGDIKKNTADVDENTQDVSSNDGEVKAVDGQIVDTQNLRTGVQGQLNSLQASLNSCEDDAERVAIEGDISTLEAEMANYDSQISDFNNQKTDLVKTGEALKSDGVKLDADGKELQANNKTIKSDIAVAEADAAKAEELAKAEAEKAEAEMQTDVSVQNNKGWQYYAELELKAAHGNDPNYKPSPAELSAKADEIKQRNIENGKVNKKGDLRIGTPNNPKYVSLNGEIDTSGLQTTDQALVKYNQGQNKLAKDAEAKSQAEIEKQRLEESRNFSVNLKRDLSVKADTQDYLDKHKHASSETKTKSVLSNAWNVASQLLPKITGAVTTVWTNVYEAPRGSGSFTTYDENGNITGNMRRIKPNVTPREFPDLK